MSLWIHGCFSTGSRDVGQHGIALRIRLHRGHTGDRTSNGTGNSSGISRRRTREDAEICVRSNRYDLLTYFLNFAAVTELSEPVSLVTGELSEWVSIFLTAHRHN